MDILQALINAAQVFLDTGFSSDDFWLWQQLAFVTILALLGPFHYYTRHFGEFTEKPSKSGLLAGEGILEAAKEEIARGVVEPLPDGKIEPSAMKDTYTPWLNRTKKWHSLDYLRSIIQQREKMRTQP
jgi:hypothetical protein